MTAPRIDLEQMARELGLTPEQAGAHIREAIAAGLLLIAGDDGDHVTLMAGLPDEVTK